MNTKIKKIQRERRKKRIRAKIFGTAERPRLSVFKSNKYVSAQLVDDGKGITLVSGTTKTLKAKNMREKAKILGENIGKAALAKKISLAVFDRGGYLYAGSVAALADGAREAGLKF
jgi:large subunit ribosomal protein L18